MEQLVAISAVHAAPSSVLDSQSCLAVDAGWDEVAYHAGCLCAT